MIGIAPVVGTAVWWLSVRGVSNLGDEKFFLTKRVRFTSSR